MNDELPYIEETLIIKKYNPRYGDMRICVCGHDYYRHFDPYAEMEAVGCKYCACNSFVEAKQIFIPNDEKNRCKLCGKIIEDGVCKVCNKCASQYRF